jgi:modulator of FtsH protease HflK
MAWNQPGKGNQDPWRGKNQGGSGLDGLLGRLREVFGGGGGYGPLAGLAVGLVLLVLFNSFKLVDERQRGVVLRFGAFNRIMTPGANFKWPWPIETATIVDATRIQSLDVDVDVLTRDENIVHIRFNAQYQIADARLYLYGFRDDDRAGGKSVQGVDTIQNAAESAVREVVGNNTMDDVLFERDKLVVAARLHLQESLDQYKTGLKVTEFTLQNARPPEQVKPAFDDAISAREDKSRIESEATAYASRIVPEARGTAARIKAESEGYRTATIAKAEGDASRFRQLVEQYRKSPEVTRKRMYLDTMQEVIASNPRIVSGRGNTVLLQPAPAGAAATAPPLPAVTQLPGVKATTPASPDPSARPDRPTNREEVR